MRVGDGNGLCGTMAARRYGRMFSSRPGAVPTKVHVHNSMYTTQHHWCDLLTLYDRQNADSITTFGIGQNSELI